MELVFLELIVRNNTRARDCISRLLPNWKLTEVTGPIIHINHITGMKEGTISGILYEDVNNELGSRWVPFFKAEPQDEMEPNTGLELLRLRAAQCIRTGGKIIEEPRLLPTDNKGYSTVLQIAESDAWIGFYAKDV